MKKQTYKIKFGSRVPTFEKNYVELFNVKGGHLLCA